jgi:hypothetical protein
MLEEENNANINPDLLDTLRTLAANENFLSLELTPEVRETLTAFYRESQGIITKELLAGKYGISILLDILTTIMFETGYRMGLNDLLRKTYSMRRKDLDNKKGEVNFPPS